MQLVSQIKDYNNDEDDDDDRLLSYIGNLSP